MEISFAIVVTVPVGALHADASQRSSLDKCCRERNEGNDA